MTVLRDGVEQSTGTGAVAADFVEDEFTATDGQTVFTLSDTPVDLDTFRLIIEGVDMDRTADFTVSGTTLTWLGSPSMDAGWKVRARYVK